MCSNSNVTAFSVAQTSLQAVYAFNHDHGTVHANLDDIIYLPYPKGLLNGRYFGNISNIVHSPLRAVWFFLDHAGIWPKDNTTVIPGQI